MKNLISILCLTFAVLLGSAGVSWSGEKKTVTFQVTGPDGSRYEVEAPEGTPHYQISAAVEAQIAGEELRRIDAEIAANSAPSEPVPEEPGAVGLAEMKQRGFHSMVEETAWIPLVILQWVLLLAPAVALRKYRRRPMSKRGAIGTSAAMGVFWCFAGVMLAHELGPINTAPIAFASLISFWILRKATVLDGDSSLKMSDRVFKKIFPETNTARPAQAQRSQHPDQISAPPINKPKAEKSGNYIRDYVVSPLRPHDSQLQKVSPSRELNTTPIPEIDEDALYEQAFNELQGGERVVSTWSRAFAEAAGDGQKAKALYISARVASLKQGLLEMSEADRLEAERLAKAEAERKAEEEAKEKAKEEAAAKEIEDAVWGKKIDEYRKMLIESGMNTVLAVEHTSLMAPKKTRQKTLLLIDGLRKRKSIEERK
jgi:hypothetical protein